MARFIISILILLLSFYWFPFNADKGAFGAEDEAGRFIRPSILAGTWYPGSPKILKRTVDAYLNQAKVPPLKGHLKAIIVPHAGYRYSGQVAAYAYRLLRGRSFKRVILVGPSHRVPFPGISVNLQAGYRTPLGVVPVDRATAEAILHTDSRIHWYKDVHAVEHSLEIQLPFLQSVLTIFSIVPILMGQQDFETCALLARVLAQIVRSSDSTLLIASSDLSHFHSYAEAKKLDKRFIHLVEAMDPKGLYKALGRGECEACGGGPVIAVLLACKRLGATRCAALYYANSGDVTGEKDRVVGYMAGAVFTSSDKDPHPK
ncbi:MAG: AmmeMemoRadiSam system protein B [Deltaproteobacteria bacterium]|nr:MAG: AmmeMemoRadiSam system protein B [Deltaproteobacteria bacterium]